MYDMRRQCPSRRRAIESNANDAGRRRLLASGHRGDNVQQSLPVTTAYGSAYYCVVGAMDFEEPTHSEFDAADNTTLSLLITSRTTDFVASVGKVSEVAEFDGSPPEDSRRTGLIERVCCGAKALSTEGATCRSGCD